MTEFSDQHLSPLPSAPEGDRIAKARSALLALQYAEATSLVLEDPKPPVEDYPRDMVTWIKDDEEDWVPVVTYQNLVQFRDEQHGKIQQNSYVMYTLLRRLGDAQWFLPDGLLYYGDGTETTEEVKFFGIRADKLSQFVQQLKSGELQIPFIGKGSIQLLAQYSEALNA